VFYFPAFRLVVLVLTSVEFVAACEHTVAEFVAHEADDRQLGHAVDLGLAAVALDVELDLGVALRLVLKAHLRGAVVERVLDQEVAGAETLGVKVLGLDLDGQPVDTLVAAGVDVGYCESGEVVVAHDQRVQLVAQRHAQVRTLLFVLVDHKLLLFVGFLLLKRDRAQRGHLVDVVQLVLLKHGHLHPLGAGFILILYQVREALVLVLLEAGRGAG